MATTMDACKSDTEGFCLQLNIYNINTNHKHAFQMVQKHKAHKHFIIITSLTSQAFYVTSLNLAGVLIHLIIYLFFGNCKTT